MASQLNKYAQNIARARYATPTIPATGVRTSRAKISVSGDKGGSAPAARGASAEAAKVPTGVEPGEPTAPEYNPIIDAETMSPPVDPNRQEAILNQARAPRFAIGNPNVGNIDLGSLLSARPTEGFDPNAPIGGQNVPFQETKGVGGFFRRMFGDTANEQNIAAQRQQAAEWKAEDTLAKQRQAKREDLAEEIRLREEGPTKRFEAEQKRLKDKEIRDEIAREDAINLQLAREGEKDILSDIDMARKEANEAKERALKTRELDIKEQALKPPRYSPIGNTGLFQTPEGELAIFEPEVMRISDAMPGRKAGFRMLTGEGAKAPKRSVGDVEVDRLTNKPLGAAATKATTPAVETPVNTALLPRFGRALGSAATTVGQEFTDPLRALGTGAYKALISSQAEQDPEVLKRMRARAQQMSEYPEPIF